MSREPIRWNRDALDSLKETALGVLVLVVLPLSTIPAAHAIAELWGQQ